MPNIEDDVNDKNPSTKVIISDKSKSDSGKRASVTERLPRLRVTVVGGARVGKSALAVRLLTRRYIGEYQPTHSTLYYKELELGEERISLELLETNERNVVQDTEEVLLVVYSITDRLSVLCASDILESSRISSPGQVLLLGNKKDLDHLREVYTGEGISLASRHRVQFSEISIAESNTDLDTVLSPVLVRLWTSKIRAFHLQQKERETDAAKEKLRKQGVWSLLTNILGGSKTNNTNGVSTSERAVERHGRSSLPPDLG